MMIAVGLNRGENTTNAMTFLNYLGELSAFSINYTAVSEFTDSVVTFAARGGNYTYKQGITYNYIIVFQD